MFKIFKARRAQADDPGDEKKLKLRERPANAAGRINAADSVLTREMDRRHRRRAALRRPSRAPVVVVSLMILTLVVSLFVYDYADIPDLDLAGRGLAAVTILKGNPDNEPARAELKIVAAELLRGDLAGSRIHESVRAVYTLTSLAAGGEGTWDRGRKVFRDAFPDSRYAGYLFGDRVTAPCDTCGGDGRADRACARCAAKGVCASCSGSGKRASLATSRGGVKRVASANAPGHVRCTACAGSRKCATCEGSGQVQSTCRDCHGKGDDLSSKMAREQLRTVAGRAQWMLRGDLILGRANNVMADVQDWIRRE